MLRCNVAKSTEDQRAAFLSVRAFRRDVNMKARQAISSLIAGSRHISRTVGTTWRMLWVRM